MISLIQTMVCSLFSFDEDVDINDDFFLTSKTSVLSLSVCVHDVEQAREEEGQEGRYSSPHSIEFYRIRGGQEETSSVGVDAHECMCFLSPFMSQEDSDNNLLEDDDEDDKYMNKRKKKHDNDDFEVSRYSPF